jgi:steroid 5-alpha reductase family enzyme
MWRSVTPLHDGVVRQSPLFWGDYACLALWAVGFIIETTSDAQKFLWRKDPANKAGGSLRTSTRPMLNP